MHDPIATARHRRSGAARLALTGLLAAALCPGARAMTLAEAFDAAREHDPQYRAAARELDAARQGIPIARSALLPQVSLSYSNVDVSGSRDFPNSLGQDVNTRVDYSAPQTTLSMRIPLFNYDAWTRLDQATAQTTGAEATYRVRGLELVDRVITAYLQVLQARASVALADAEVTSLDEQARRAEHRFRRGEGTRTDEALVRSSLEAARARLGDAHQQVALAAARLRRLTGQMPAFVQDAAPDFRPRPFEPTALGEWSAATLAQNPVIEVRRAAVEAARYGVKRSQAGHLPRLDLVASSSNSRNESLSSLDQRSRLNSLGIQLSLPLFSGFGVQASVRQAEAELARVEEELNAERENNELEVRRLLQAADSAALRADALREAVAAGEIAVTGASMAVQAGVVTQSDVLEASSRLYAYRRDLALALYDHLASRMRLMVLAGEPMQRVVDEIGALLVVQTTLQPTDTSAKSR